MTNAARAMKSKLIKKLRLKHQTVNLSLEVLSLVVIQRGRNWSQSTWHTEKEINFLDKHQITETPFHFKKIKKINQKSEQEMKAVSSRGNFNGVLPWIT